MSKIKTKKDSCVTESQILLSAIELFFVKGKINATSQEIADFCGVQRTLVNYYFKSKNSLFSKAHSNVVSQLLNPLTSIYVSNIPFEEKIDMLIDCVYAYKMKYPFFEVINVIRFNNLMDDSSFSKPSKRTESDFFLDEIAHQMKIGKIHESDPINFILNILSMISFPLMMKELYKGVFAITDKEFEKLAEERKELIKKIIYK